MPERPVAKKGSGALLAMAAGACALLVLGGGAFAMRGWIVEEWTIHQLLTGPEPERALAAKRLGEIGTARCISSLVSALNGKECDLNSWAGRCDPMLLDDPDEWLSRLARDTLEKIGGAPLLLEVAPGSRTPESCRRASWYPAAWTRPSR